MGKKSRAILLNSDFTGEEMDIKIEGGFCKVDMNKDERYEFFMDRSRPIKVTFNKSPFKKETYDFYLLSWKSLIPIEFNMDEKKIKSENLESTLKKEGMSQEDIEKAIKEKEKKEEEKGKTIKRFLYRTLRPIVLEKKHWAKTELPTIMRETGEMRFLKQLKAYTEGAGVGRTIGGKGLVIGFMAIFMIAILIYSFVSAGVFG